MPIRVMRQRLLVRWWILVCALAACSGVWAHPTQDSHVVLDIQHDAVRAALSMPLPDLLAAEPGLARQGGEPTAILADAALRNYVLLHLRAGSLNEPAWEMQVLSWRLMPPPSPDLPPTVDVSLLLKPGRQPFDHFRLSADWITHEVRNHSIQVLLRSDWEAGLAQQAPVLLGSLGHDRRQITVSRNVSAPYAAWRSLVYQGAQHIAVGYDHLLFLALVLLTACLVKKEQRWVGVSPPGAATRRAVGVITAFTAGHSLTLALAALGVVRANSYWVELWVALSIVLSAVNVLRPVLGEKEAWVAGGFGLVHGLAFAQALEVLHLAPQHRIAALFGFNLGVELVQVLLAIVFVPLMVYVLRFRLHHRVRALSGWVALAAGAGLCIQRATA